MTQKNFCDDHEWVGYGDCPKCEDTWAGLTPAQPVPASADDLLNAAINCPHSIESESVTLRFDPKQPGHNALNQLGRRLSAVKPARKPLTDEKIAQIARKTNRRFWEETDDSDLFAFASAIEAAHGITGDDE